MNSEKQTTYIRYLLVALFVLQIAAFAWIAYIQFEVRSNAKIEAQSIQENAADIRKLKHCQNHDITPCDESAIRDWNQSNPAKTFGL